MGNINNDLDFFLNNEAIITSNIAQRETAETMHSINNRTLVYIEMMAAAFLKQTGIPADHVELIMEQSADGLRYSWYFRERKQ